MTASALRIYIVTVVLVLGATYLLTRSSILIGDGQAFVDVALAGDPAHLHYAEPGHFLQVPLARGVWRALNVVAPIPMVAVLLGLSLLGMLAGAVCVGLIAAEVSGYAEAAWIGAALFGFSLNPSTQWNGELYGLAVGFAAAGILMALRKRTVLAGALWALSVLCHVDFLLALPAFAVAVHHATPPGERQVGYWRRTATLFIVAGMISAVVLTAGSRLVGKWTDSRSFATWLHRSDDSRERYFSERPEVVRAVKGLFTAYSVSGHVWRDALTSRGTGTRAFHAAAAVGLAVIGFTALCLILALGQPRLLWLGVAWVLPFHVVFNWWFIPTVEKYHSGALPGFVLIVTAGMLTLITRMKRPVGALIAVVCITLFASLNLVAAVLPMRALGADVANATAALRALQDERQGRAVFIACDDPKALVAAHAPFLRVRSIWTGTIPEIQARIGGWTRARLAEHKEPYVVGRWCLPEEWNTTASKARFDLFFLEQSYQLVPTRITGIPILQSVPTDPFSWTYGDVVRVEPR